jgi:hypothetical protein
MARTGRSTRPETNQPSAPETTVITPRPTRENSSRLFSARCRTLAAPVFAPAVKACLHAATVAGSRWGCLHSFLSLFNCPLSNPVVLEEDEELVAGRFAATSP